MRKTVFLVLLCFSALAQAQTPKDRNEADKLRRRVDELENTVKALQDKIQKMEATLMKGGGFMIVANFTCEIKTPFDGEYTATELSESAARNSVMEQCKAKASDKNQCSSLFVKCSK